MTDELLDALECLEPYGPEFGGFLANHGPMAAESLIQLGAADAVAGWVDRYRRRLEPRPVEGDRVVNDDWRRHLGVEGLVGDWTSYFRRQLASDEWSAVLVRWWPRLLPGVAASATHGVIRTAHAVRALRSAPQPAPPQLLEELARGLGFWAALYQPIVGRPAGDGPSPAAVALARMPRLDPAAESDEPGITGRLRLLDQVDGLPAAFDRWAAGSSVDAAFDDIVIAAARVVARRDEAPIAYCHALTAPAAMRLVLTELPPDLHRPTAVAAWHAAASIVAAFAAPARAGDHQAVEQPDIDAVEVERLRVRLAAAAVEHGDEHVIKFTEAAVREHDRIGDVELLVAAEKFAGRIAAAPTR